MGFQIETKEVVIHDSDVPNALIDYIVHNKIRNIVLGAAQRNALMRSLSLPLKFINICCPFAFQE